MAGLRRILDKAMPFKDPEKAREATRKGCKRYFHTEKGKAARKRHEAKPSRKEYRREWMAEWRKNHPEETKAILRKSWHKDPDRKARRNADMREYMKTWLPKRRQELLAFWGTAFSRCGFSDWRALQIDHVNPDAYPQNGSQGRTNGLGKTSQSSWLRFVREHPEQAKRDFQLLCANCNWIKRYENREGAKYK